MKLYLAGPMRGISNHNFPAFDEATKKLQDLGHQVVNPAELSRESGVNYNPDGTCTIAEFRQLLTIDLAFLADCDGIALLPGWQRSQGARLELLFATMVGMKVLTSEGQEYFKAPALIANVIFDGQIYDPAQDHVVDFSSDGSVTRLKCKCGAQWAMSAATGDAIFDSIRSHHISVGLRPSEVL